MENLNQLISVYISLLKQGETQAAYKGILDFICKLRADFIKKYPTYEAGSIYQGYMDMSYFSLNTKHIKDAGLKLAVVYLHEKGQFEVWLSARNRDISKKYESIAYNAISDMTLFHDKDNKDAIIECMLSAAPDFEHPDLLVSIIEQGVESFINTVTKLIK